MGQMETGDGFSNVYFIFEPFLSSVLKYPDLLEIYWGNSYCQGDVQVAFRQMDLLDKDVSWL